MDPRDLPGGGPAFPPMHDPDTHASGMTLRDYFAAKVIPEFLELCGSYATAAKEAYAVADAMLAARE
jgi:hypothetical protein